MIMVAHGGDSQTIRDRTGKSAADLKREKFISAFMGAQGNPTSFINNLGLTNAADQPRPPRYQAPQHAPMITRQGATIPHLKLSAMVNN